MQRVEGGRMVPQSRRWSAALRELRIALAPHRVVICPGAPLPRSKTPESVNK
jgi:hypothetical protein